MRSRLKAKPTPQAQASAKRPLPWPCVAWCVMTTAQHASIVHRRTLVTYYPLSAPADANELFWIAASLFLHTAATASDGVGSAA